MCDCPDSCKGSAEHGCVGKRELFDVAIDIQLELLMSKTLALRLCFADALAAKSAAKATPEDLEKVRDHVVSEQREMEKALEIIKRRLGSTCIKMRVALGGTRED